MAVTREDRSAPWAPGVPTAWQGRAGPETGERIPAPLDVSLLGGFRVERPDTGLLDCEWPRRSAKTLTKLLATVPGHSLHREQVMEILWPDVPLGSALNSFGKALHAARHALEPELPRRSSSTYLRLTDCIVAIDTRHVDVDADRFQGLAEAALRRRDIAAYESALAVYAGELLPEDRYEDWCAERRRVLAELNVRLLLGLADLLEARGDVAPAVDCLREVLSEDPTREEVHRRLIRLWAETGCREQAIRQFHTCEQMLRRDLDLVPQPETVSLFQDVLANRVQQRGPGRARQEADPSRPPVTGPPAGKPFVGRESVLGLLRARLGRVDDQARMILLSGEAGVGKTRVIEMLASEANRDGAAVLWGGVGTHVRHLPYGPLALALERFAAGRPEGERRQLVERYPSLARLVPSLSVNHEPPPSENRLDLALAVVRLLTDLASTRPLLLVMGDLDDADPLSLDALRYFAHLARQRRWLLIGAVRDDELDPMSRLARVVDAMVRERLCAQLQLPCLARAACDELVRALPAGAGIDETGLERIYAYSRGNPLFIEELVAGAGERAKRRPAGASAHRFCELAGPVPQRIRAMVSAQVRTMDQTLRRVLTLAAAGGAAEIPLSRLLAAASALEPPVCPPELFDALDRALEMRVLQEGESGHAFRHPLVRSALYQELSGHRREELRAAFGFTGGASSRRLRVTAAR
jgi:DNA-binding SARP family transcriptional activator